MIQQPQATQLPSSNQLQELNPQILLSSPAGLAYESSHGQWQLSKHLAYLNRKIVDAIRYRNYRIIIIEMPPRHGKSTFISQYLPAWFLGINPSKHVLLASYEADYAATWSRRTRDLLREIGPSYFHIEIKEDFQSANNWEIAHFNGGMASVGVGGPGTGKDANLLIIDDPIKNSKEAKSKLVKADLVDWFNTVAYPRLDPDGICILMNTRWAEDDLTGHILSTFDPSLILRIHFPAFAEAPSSEVLEEQGINFDDWRDELGRKDGDALWPERYSRERLLEIKTNQNDEGWWSALYQQSPTTPGGSIFKEEWWRRFTPLINTRYWRIAQFIDSAFKTGPSSDYSASAIWGQNRQRESFLLQVNQGKYDFPDLLAFIKRENDRISAIHHMRIPIIIEDKASGQSAAQVLKKDKRFTTIAFKLKGTDSKEARAESSTPEIQSGKLWIPYGKEFDFFIYQHSIFPSGKHDEYPDTTTMMVAFWYLSRKGPIKTIKDYL